jgi:hypothetical protein
VNFPCRWRSYRKWLKSVTAEELARPVEEVHGLLAIRLDEVLSSKSKQWASADDHLSRALLLVELTYPAIAAALGDGDRAEMCESWAQQRSANVRELILQLAGPGAALSCQDLARVLRQRSEARRAVRLQAFDIDEAPLAPYFDRIQVPDVPAGGVVVLLGDFGSGKSETAEAWHRAGIKNLMAGRDAPFPLWLNARDVLGQTLEGAVERQFGPTWHVRGAWIAVDGLDETDPGTAQTLLEAARVLVKTFVNTRVLLTARPGVVSPTSTEELKPALLTETEALEIVQLAGGKSHNTFRWTADMRATVTRPFFALAAGVMLGRDEAPRGEADLIRSLVENALAKGTERSAVTSAVTHSVLVNLAVALTRGHGDGLSFRDRQIARSSRLVADGPKGSVLFALPILQHWFAAQALLAGAVPAAEVVADAHSFIHWQWAAAVALLSAPGASAIDDLIATWIAGNSGAGAWVLKEAFSGLRHWRSEQQELDAKTSGPRLLRALRTWNDALGPFAKGVLPFPLVRGPVGLGVTVSGPRVDVAFSSSQPTTDYVTEVPPGVHPLVGVTADGWRPWISGGAPDGDAWPWIMVRNTIAKATLKKLSNDPFLGAPDGIWVQERRFDLARRLANRGSLFHGRLPADEVRRRAEERFTALRRDRSARISFSGSATYSGAELEDLLSWIDARTPAYLASLLPEADRPNSAGRWVWDRYSPQRLMEFEVEVYARACEAYDEALAYSCSRLAWSMPSSSFAPFGVVLELNYAIDAGSDVGPTLTAMRMPMALLPQFAPSGADAVWSASGRAAIRRAEREPGRERALIMFEAIRAWLAEQDREQIGALRWVETVADDMSNVRPASSLAAGWLWDDLKSLGLGDGAFPQLR